MAGLAGASFARTPKEGSNSGGNTKCRFFYAAFFPIHGGFAARRRLSSLGAGLGGRQGGRSAEEACGAVPGKVCPHHGAQFDTRGPRPTPHCCGEFYASTLTWAHDSIGLSMIG